MRTLAIVNLKGGSGKTTTALCLAVGLAHDDRRVLFIDADPQANATMTLLDGDSADPPTLGNVLLDQGDITGAIRPSRVENLDILPADARLADAALLLADQLGRERRLRAAMRAVAGDYDFVVIDSAPTLSLVTINVLNFAQELIVPVDAGLYSVAGLGRLQETVEEVRRHLDNPGLRIAGLVLTRTHKNKATADIEAQLRAAFGPLVFRASIPHSVRVEEAHARHRTVIEFSRMSAPARAYDALLREVLGDGQQQRPGDSDAALHLDPADGREPEPDADGEFEPGSHAA